ncbi:MAG TPA: ABC transporter permease [Anaerolineales bacterium]|nr:ABC transporter permease [Anaerolineales bacterium]
MHHPHVVLMQRFSTTPMEMIASVWRNRWLTIQMVKREVLGRYRGSTLGLAWSFFYPVVMLGVYTFVFSVVFKARWGIGGEESKANFAIILFVGMIVHGLFAECVNRAPGLILSNVNYVKKVIFPLEILPWVAMGSALFHAVISLAVLLIAQFVLNFSLPWTAIFFPLVILPLVIATMGFAWVLSATGVYVRDISQMTGIITTVLLFVSPVFYPVSALPIEYRGWLLLNPLTFVIEEARNVLIWGRVIDWPRWGISVLAGFTIAWIGFWWFQKVRKGFADVL